MKLRRLFIVWLLLSIAVSILDFYMILIPRVQASNDSTTYRGLSWYGLDAGNLDAWKMNQEGYNQMVSRYPDMNVLVLGFSSWSYSHPGRLRRLDDFVGWCEQDGIKVIISNYAETYSKSEFTTFWENMAARYAGNTTLLGFDLVNEPWGMQGSSWVEDWVGLIDDYEDIIDAIRAIDPNRKCFVQSYQRNWKGFDWIKTNPVNRTNIEYVNHIYSHNWITGAWFTSSHVYPWISYYKSGDYTTGYTKLYDELWSDMGSVINETGVEFFVTEVAAKDDAHSLRYLRDLIAIIESWGCDWAYHSYYSQEDRPLALTFTSGKERGIANQVRASMQTEPVWPILGNLIIVARAFGSRPGDTDWNSLADLDTNGAVDIYDATLVASANVLLL